MPSKINVRNISFFYVGSKNRFLLPIGSYFRSNNLLQLEPRLVELRTQRREKRSAWFPPFSLALFYFKLVKHPHPHAAQRFPDKWGHFPGACIPVYSYVHPTTTRIYMLVAFRECSVIIEFFSHCPPSVNLVFIGSRSLNYWVRTKLCSVFLSEFQRQYLDIDT